MSDRRILILEKERYLGECVGEYFADMERPYYVLEARSVSQAVEVMRDEPVDLLVSDHAGPSSIDGLELLMNIRTADVPTRVVLMADGKLEQDRTNALKMGCTCFLLKPFPEDKLCELIFRMLQPYQGFAGRVVRMRLEDIIQMFCYRHESTLISAFHEGHVGNIYVHDGEIVHAQCDAMTGVDAFYDILGWESGEFVSQVIFSAPPHTIFIDWQSLLMEGIRQKDEIRHALAPVSAPAEANQRAAAPIQRNNHGLADAEAVIRETEEPQKRIMVVDDSRFIRKIVQEILQADSGLSVAGFASNGQEALAKIDELKPDLILLDWDMPVMKGSTALMHIMIKSPCPVIVLSSFLGGVGANPIDLLCLGGVDFVRKPQNNWRVDGRADDLVRRVKEACSIRFDRIRRVRVPAQVKQKPFVRLKPAPARFLAVVGSSLGGFSDLIRLIPFLPEEMSATVLVVHDMQQETLGAFVDYLDRRSRIEVHELRPGEPLAQGLCYVHPAGVPLELIRAGDSVAVQVKSGVAAEKVLDEFLISASRLMGKNLMAALLSGGQRLGVDGLRAVKKAGGITMVQDPVSSANPAMAEAALQDGVVDRTAPAETLAETFRQLIGTS